MTKRYFSPLILLLLFLSAQVVAQKLPPRPNPPRAVNDLAQVLTSGQESSLENRLRTFNDTTSSAIVVVTLQSTGGQEIAAYAVDLAHEWGIGRSDVDNGILLLVAVKDRNVNISTGYGLEGAVPDAIAKRIIENEILPAFRQGNYDRGINNGVNALMAYASGEYEATERPEEEGLPVPIGWLSIAFFVFVFLILPRIAAKKARQRHIQGRRGKRPGLGTLLLLSMFGGGRGGGGFGGGGGGGFGGGGSGGGFGGFGGGGFGGGGASGSW